MTYRQSLRYLNSFLNLERIVYRPDNYRWNLKRMRLLLRRFADPQKDFFSVLIAGTKGKGSTGFFLESILSASGISAGFYCSPHLEDPRERVRIGGRLVSKEKWCSAIAGIRSVLAQNPLPAKVGDLTYFEVMTLLAMKLFKEAGVKVGIFEIGLGGRLDATNVLDAKIAVITPIELDHEEILGSTIAKIAAEKTAVIKNRSHVVVAAQRHRAAVSVIRRRCRARQAWFYFCPPLTGHRLGLKGDFQRINAAAAFRAADILKSRYGFPVTEQGIRAGLRCHHWPGRMEFFGGRPDFLLDGAHNPASVTALVRNLKRLYPDRKNLLMFGTSRDKKSERMLPVLSSYFKDVILTRTSNPRTQEVSRLLSQAESRFRNVFPAASPSRAFELAGKIAGPGTLVVVTGSFYLIGDVRSMLRGRRNLNKGS